MPRSGIAGLYIAEHFEELPNRFPKQLHHFTFAPAVSDGSNFSTSPVTLIFVCLFLTAIPVGTKWYLTVVLICISLMTNDIEHHFMCLLAICIFSLETSLLKSFANVLTEWLLSHCWEFQSFFPLSYSFRDCRRGHWVLPCSVLALEIKHNFIDLLNDTVENIYWALILRHALCDLG